MTTFGRLLIRLPAGRAGNAGLPRHSVQRRVTRVLAALDLTPHGLPRHAILIVRRLRDPQPGLLQVAAHRWERQARVELEQIWRRAARPAREPISDLAEAVWFADPAEWLACLSLDLYYGVAHLRWWWQTLLSTARLRQSPAPLAAVWSEQGRWLPAALAYLLQHRAITVPAMTASLSPTHVEAVWRTVSGAYDLPARLLPTRLPAGWQHRLSAARASESAVSAAQPPGTILAELALAAYYAPVALRQMLQRSAPTAAVPPATLPAVPSASSAIGKFPTRDAVPAPGSAPSTAAPHLVVPAPTEPDLAPTRSPTVPKAGTPPDITVADPTIEPIMQGKAQAEAPLPHAATTTVTPSARSAEPRAHVHDTDDAPPFEQAEGFVTAFGRIWFLLNLLVMLDLLDDELSPWLKLDALARRLLADTTPFADDPLWWALEVLAEAEATPTARNQAADWLDATWEFLWAELAARVPELRPDLWRTNAHVHLTRTHIDIVFALDAVDISLRRAGLDRNPGWVPALARVVQFHFE